jgi:hypothetical protein
LFIAFDFKFRYEELVICSSSRITADWFLSTSITEMHREVRTEYGGVKSIKYTVERRLRASWWPMPPSLLRETESLDHVCLFLFGFWGSLFLLLACPSVSLQWFNGLLAPPWVHTGSADNLFVKMCFRRELLKYSYDSDLFYRKKRWFYRRQVKVSTAIQ